MIIATLLFYGAIFSIAGIVALLIVAIDPRMRAAILEEVKG